MELSTATHCMIYVTTSSPGEARSISHMLIKENLAACANIFENATSIYRWKGHIQEDKESILFLKTRMELAQKAIQRIKSLHSNETPCAVAYEIAEGLTEYLQWVDENTP